LEREATHRAEFSADTNAKVDQRKQTDKQINRIRRLQSIQHPDDTQAITSKALNNALTMTKVEADKIDSLVDAQIIYGPYNDRYKTNNRIMLNKKINIPFSIDNILTTVRRFL
jgi:hypothetical protein